METQRRGTNLHFVFPTYSVGRVIIFYLNYKTPTMCHTRRSLVGRAAGAAFCHVLLLMRNKPCCMLLLGILLLSLLTELNLLQNCPKSHRRAFPIIRWTLNVFPQGEVTPSPRWGRKRLENERGSTQRKDVSLKEGFWIWPVCVLVFLRFSCTLRPWFAEVKNKSPVSQPSTYSGFSEVVVVMAQSRSLYKLISWSHVLVPGLRYLCVWLFAFSSASCVCCFQAQVAFLQGERKGQENMKQDLVRRIKMLEYALKQER